MTAFDIAVLAAAGLLGGFITAIAGGSSFFTFPALIFAGLGPVAAVATGAIASFPANLTAGLTARRHFAGLGRRFLYWNLMALAGGTLGALALVIGGDAVLGGLVPWLLLFATVTYAFGPQLRAALARRAPRPANARAPSKISRAALFEFFLCSVLALYGGYFGAGLGIMLLSVLAIAGIDEPRQANAVKNILATSVTVAAIVVVVAAGAVSWPHALAILCGTIVGGWAGARAADAMPAHWLRRVVIAVGATLTIWFFWRQWA